MLEIYLPTCDVPVCYENDSWFDAHIPEIEQLNKSLKNIIKCVDGVDYLGDGMIVSKFAKKQSVKLPNGVVAVATLPLSNLSTGCKTLINVTTYPDVLFSAIECGFNVLSEIVRLKKGRVHLTENISVDSFTNDIRVVAPNGSHVVHDTKELEDILDEYFMN